MNGLGANTCIQDAANLAWKVNLVEKGLAGKSLLDTYTIERRPVGKTVVERANSSLREHFPILQALGFLHPTVEERRKAMALLDSLSAEGRAQRKQLMDAIDYTAHEFLAQGSDLNQRYASSAVYLEGAGDAPLMPADATLYHEPHTYPGVRLPHAWVNTSIPGAKVSTLDLAGKGRFAMFTGHGGDAWREAADKVGRALGIEIAVYGIGYGLEYEAVYNDWYRLREVEEDGCVLVRPDNFVAWRSNSLVPDAAVKLQQVMKSVFSK